MWGWFLGVRPQTYMVTSLPAGWKGSLRPVRVLKSAIGTGSFGAGGFEPREAGLQLLDASEQLLHVLLLGIGHVDPVQVTGPVAGAASVLNDNAAGHTHHRGIRWHVAQHNGVGADLRAGAHGEAAQHLGARANRHTVFNGRMALARLFASAAQGHALQDRDVVANLGRFADDHTGTVVDEQAGADLGSRVNLDLGQEAVDLRQRASEDAAVVAIEPMSDAVQQQCMKAGVGEDYFPRRCRGGVALEDGLHVTLDAGQGAPQRPSLPILRPFMVAAKERKL